MYSLLFSSYDSAFITSSGHHHINFWRIVQTSSGVKMDKLPGMFGRKQPSNIEAFIQLSDGKVLSGCTWGSLLLWLDGKIKVEIKRRDMSTCHKGSVLQFVVAEGELISIGQDGWIRVWDLESIQQAEGMNQEREDSFFLLDPINEVQVAPDAILQSISRSKVPSTGEETFWYIQDAGGGIWKVDLSFSLTMKKPEKILQCHAGGVTCLVTNPSQNILVSGGSDGRINTYNLKRNVLTNSIKYHCSVTCMSWIPLQLDKTGTHVLIGFHDGVLRLYYIMSNAQEGNLVGAIKSLSATMKLLQAVKPHREAIAKLSIKTHESLAASACEDNTIYVYRLEKNGNFVKINPIGYFQFDKKITGIDFSLSKDLPTLLIGMVDGTFQFLNLSSLPLDSDQSTKLERGSYHQMLLNSTTLCSLPTTSKLVALWYKDEKSIQFATQNDDEVLLQTIVNDCGNSYSNSEKLVIETPTKNSKLSLILPPFKQNYIICGFSDGFLKIITLSKPQESSKWMQAISDSDTGKITDILLMNNKLITSGMDGTLFVFHSAGDFLSVVTKKKSSWGQMKGGFQGRVFDSSGFENVHDIEDPNHLCIEDMNRKVKEEQNSKEVEEKIMKIQKDVSNLKRDFKKLLVRNEALPREFKLEKEMFTMTDYTYKEIEDGINKDLEKTKQSFQKETDEAMTLLSNLKSKYFDPVEYNKVSVKGFLSRHELSTFRLAHLKDDNLHSDEKEEIKISEIIESFTPKTPKLANGIGDASTYSDTLEAESNLSSSLTASKSKSEVKITNERILKALSKQEIRREKKMQRKREWDDLYSRKPRESDEDPTLIEEIQQARENIGDFSRKTSEDYKSKKTIKPHEVSETLQKIVREIYLEKRNFNEEVLKIQAKKLEVIQQLEVIYKEIIDIQDNLDLEDRIPIPSIPQIEADEQDVDIFSIDQREVEKMKEKLLSDESRVGPKQNVGSRRSSRASIVGKKMSRQFSFTSRRSSVSGQAAQPKAEKKADGILSNYKSEAFTFQEEECDVANEFGIQKSVFESTMEEKILVQSKYEQTEKAKEMNKIMENFDKVLFGAIVKKVELESRLKFAELSLIFLFEEHKILDQDLELEAELKANVMMYEKSLAKVNDKLEGVEKQLKNKQMNVETFKEQKRSIDETVERELSDNKHAEYLWELYNKKPPARLTEDCYADIALETGVDSTFVSSIKPGDNVSDNDEVKNKPNDLDMETFKLIKDFRSKRHNAEAGLSAERRLEDNIGRELSNLKTISAAKEQTLLAAQANLQKFMMDKQRQLNALDQLVIVKLHDCRYLDIDRLHRATSTEDQLLAFPEDTLTTLQQRTEQLKFEKNKMKNKYKETKGVYEDLTSSCKKLKKEIAKLSEKCNIEMEKRFGPGVTLETLESFAVNRTLEEMKESLQRKEKAFWKMEDKKEEEVQRANQLLNEEIFEGADIKEKYTELLRRKLANIERKQKRDKLIESNARKRDSDATIELELAEMSRVYKAQRDEIMGTKAVLMDYLLKAGRMSSEPMKKPARLRALSSRMQLEPTRLQADSSHLQLEATELLNQERFPKLTT